MSLNFGKIGSYEENYRLHVKKIQGIEYNHQSIIKLLKRQDDGYAILKHSYQNILHMDDSIK